MTPRQGACKLYMAIKDRTDIANMMDSYRKLYIEMMPEGPKSRRYQVLNKYVDLCILLYKAYASIIIGVLNLCPFYPVAMYALQGRFDYILSVYVPFVDPWTGFGCVVNSIYHIFCLLLVGNGSLAADNGFILFVIHFAASTNLFAVQIDELNEYLTIPEDRVNQNERKSEIKAMLDGIIEAHKNIITKIKRLDTMLFFPIAVQIFTAVFSLSISLFLAATVS
jgi:7tm Odorant receptor